MKQINDGGSVALGTFLVVVAAFFLVFAAGIPYPMSAGQGGIGPRTFPIVLALLVGAAGVLELTRAIVWRLSLKAPAAKRAASPNSIASPTVDSSETESRVDVTADRSTGRLLTALGLIFAYVAVMPFVGFSISSAAFATLFAFRLGMRWHFALIAAASVTLAIKLLFTGLFRVQLPGW